jgi:predicted permease
MRDFRNHANRIDELESHIRLEADRLQTEEGISETEALYAARRTFGNVTSVQERLYETGRWIWLDNLRRDLRHALRRLAKNWKVAAVAAISLGVALSLCIVAFSFADRAFFAPPAADNARNLFLLYSSSRENAQENISYLDYVYFRDHSQSFSGVTAFPYNIEVNFSLQGGKRRDLVFNQVVGNYFQVMGIRPFKGRMFDQHDEDARARVAVLTYRGWLHLGADPNIVGTTVDSGDTFTIVGVAPEGFPGATYGFSVDLILPYGTVADMRKKPELMNDRSSRGLYLVGRLRDGVKLAAAKAEMQTLNDQLAAAYPKTNANRTAVLKRFTGTPPDMAEFVFLFADALIAVVLLVLLIASSNVASLLLALATGRKQEALIKMAAGAPRRRLVREFLAESSIIVIAGAAISYAFGVYAVTHWSTFTLALIPGFNFPVVLDLRLDLIVFAAMLAVALLTSLGTGLGPALLYSSVPNLAVAISGESGTAGPRKHRVRNALIAVQVTACTVTLVCAGLCLQSVVNLRRVKVGFRADRLAYVDTVLNVPLDFKGSSGAPAQSRNVGPEQLRQAAASLAGVESATIAKDMPFGTGSPESPVTNALGNKLTKAAWSIVDERYFATLGIPLLAGRTFDSTDRPGQPPVVVINRLLAGVLWPSKDSSPGTALGKQLLIGDPGKGKAQSATVVGVVENSLYDDLEEDPRAFYYSPLSQNPSNSVAVAVRTAGDPNLWMEPLVAAVNKLNAATPLPPQTMLKVIDTQLLLPKIAMNLAFGVSAIGLVLAAMGIFGTVSHSVSERKRELGIRLALGADTGKLLKMVLRSVLWIAGGGVIAGCAIGVAIAAVVESLLYRVRPVELPILIPVAASMLFFALLAAWIGARRWLRIDPMEAVRHT